MAKNSVYVIPTACIVCLLWWSNSNCVKGQPVFQTPANAVFGRDAILTCEVTFNAGTGRSWRKNGVAITSLATDISGTGRYSEISNSSSFSLVISEAVVSDEAEYYCDYNFLVSATKPLYFDRPATNEGVSCRKNSNDKMDIVISNVYPNATVDLVTLQAEGGTVETITGSLSETGSGDYYNYTWTSADVINTGKYECQITITTRSPTVIVLDCTFGTTTTTTTATTITSPTTATTTSSVPTSTTSISTSTTDPGVSFHTATSTVTASPTASSVSSTKITVKATSTSSTTVNHVADRNSDKGLITMIIVVSVIGGVLIVAIFSVIFVMMHWKSCLARRGHSKQYSQRSDHRKQHRQAEYNATGRCLTTTQDHAMEGYYIYNGRYKIPLFCDPINNASYMNNYYSNQKNSHDPKYVSSEETYQSDYNWDIKDRY